MPKPRVNLRIGIVQFSPKIGQVQANLTRARELCKKIQPKSLDILCFPEMAFTGYVFEDAAAISPFLEKPRTGPSCEFCSELAKKLQCYVVAGYPEVLNPEELEPDATKDGPNHRERSNDGTASTSTTVHQVGANSAALYGPDGEWAGGYRKSHLYITDLSWAKPGDGFKTFHLPSPLNTMSLGICMDLNPQIPNWTLAEGPYEIADYCLEQKANVLILLNAWLDSKEEVEEVNDWSTLNYWAARLKPLWTNGRGDDDDEGRTQTQPTDDSQEQEKETVVVICNRSGEENGTTFAGTSAIFSMVAGCGRPKLLDMMERREEGVRIWNIQV